MQLRGVHKRFGDDVALEHIDLDVQQGEFLSFLGPSGCGKTTLLRIIAGFEEPTEGAVLIGGSSALDIPPYRRPVNTVFQSYALFPHMTVKQNVLFGLKMARVPKAEAEDRAEEALRLVEIERFATRKPGQLSGGQRQRVALARAIVNRPQVLLLDEPLGALDLKLRKQLQIELMQLQRQLGITFIYVTHDQEEALVMSDRIAVMKTGLIDQLGSVDTIYERPRTRYVATFLGSSNLIEGTVRDAGRKLSIIDTAHGPLRTRLEAPAHGEPVTLSVRPEKIYLRRDGSPSSDDKNTLTGVVEELIYTGVENQYLVRVGDALMSVYIMNKALSDHEAFAVGARVQLVIPAQSVVPLDD